jgi:hypothetical protein
MVKGRAWRIAAAVIAVILLFAFGGVKPFNSWRFGVPPTILLVNQERSKSTVQQLSGLILPLGARVLVASGDGSEKNAHWVIYAPSSIGNLPFDKGLNQFIEQHLSEDVRIIENEIAPYKLTKPTATTYHRWSHRNTDNQASVVLTANGQYMLLQTFRDD